MVSGQEGEHDIDREKLTPPELTPPEPVELVNFSLDETIHSENALDLPKGLVKEFVALLNEQPATSSSVEFLKIKAWFQWLNTTVGAASLSLTDTGGVVGFELELKPATSPTLRFTSADFRAALGLGLDPSGDPEATSGLPGDGKTLILGLDPPKDSPDLVMKLSDVLTFAGLPGSDHVLPFLNDVGLTLDRHSRNAIWFEPKDSYKTVIRLQFTVPLGKIREFFTDYLLMKAEGPPNNGRDASSHTLGPIDAAYIVVKKTMREMGWQPDRKRFSMEVNVALVAKFTIKLKSGASIGFSVALTSNPRSFDFDLVPDSGSLDNVLVWLATTAGIDGFITQKNAMMSALGIETIDLTRISLTFATNQFKPIYIRIELRVVHQEAVFLFSYTWSEGGGKLRAELWPKSLMSALGGDQRRLQPGWEEYLVFKEPNSKELGLTSLFNTDNSPPSELGGHMSHLALEVSGSEIDLDGRLSLQTAKGGFSFDSITFSGSYKKKEPNPLDISFTVCCSLQGDPPEMPAYMTGKVGYKQKLWTLSVSIENLSISALGKFLGGPASSGDIMEFVGKLQIVSLDITYTFPGDFSSEGYLRLGDFELGLKFTHHGGVCEFTAKLHPTSKESTIGKVLDSITGSVSSLNLPSFVTDIKLGGGEGDGKSDIATVIFSKKDGEPFFAASFLIGPLKFTFLQYRRAGSQVRKRIIKVSAQLPSFKIPMIDNDVQPFGELFFMWVDAPADGPAPAGFTADEVSNINARLEDPEFLMFKQTSEEENVSVIAEGLHFVLIGEETRAVTIDYVFSKPAKSGESKEGGGGVNSLKLRQPHTPSSSPSTPAPAAAAAENTTEDPTEDPTEETHMAVYKKSIGPLSISNIGLQYKNNALAVHLDAELLVGPVGLSLLGLMVKITLNDKLNLLESEIEVSLDGMAVSFDKSPIEIAGLLKHTETETEESYEGGLIVGFDPYRFMAAGVYTKTFGDHGFKSVFVFGKLEGPLIILEFAEICGITGGFGYNIDLRLPEVNEVLQFPFLADISSEPRAALATMYAGGFFKPSEGSFWVAAGLTVKAFQSLTIDAVVVVGWNPYVSLGIFGVAVIDVPKVGKTEPKAKLLRIELGFAATVDFRTGVMKFEGQLTQNSYILHPDCHLTGGFAICYWFPAADEAEAEANSSLEGDWVVSIGGYHRQFIRPAHYPKPPPRLGISWKVSKSISIIGEAYFAITPKVCMGGVRLHAAVSLGPLEAYFDAHADFLINYDPFHFIADIGVSVSVNYTLDLWFVSHNITVEIDANVHLEGPPFSGTVYVDFYIVGFSIDFGPGAAKVEKASLKRFYQLVIQDDGTKEKVDGDHVLGCLSGMIANGPEDDDPKNWNVRAGDFSFRIACRFPIKSAAIGLGVKCISGVECVPGVKCIPGVECFPDVECVAPGPVEIYAKPMELTAPLSSIMTIHIQRITPHPESLEWNVDSVMKNVPSALWGIYDSSTDPMKNNQAHASILKTDNPTIPLTMGVTISAPSPRLPVGKGLLFDPAKQKPENAFPEDRNYPNFPTTSPASTKWHPAKLLEKEGEQRVIPKGEWDDVSKRWQESSKNLGTVSKWCSAFSWKASLKAKAPDQLIKNFGTLYMAAPTLTVAE